MLSPLSERCSLRSWVRCRPTVLEEHVARGSPPSCDRANGGLGQPREAPWGWHTRSVENAGSERPREPPRVPSWVGGPRDQGHHLLCQRPDLGTAGGQGRPGWLRSPGQGRLRLKPARVRASWMRRWPLLGPQGCWGQCQLRHGPRTPSVRVSCAGDLRGRAGGGPRAAGRRASGRASRSTLSTVPFSPIITNWTHCIFIASNFPSI